MQNKIIWSLILSMLMFLLSACGSLNTDTWLPDKKVAYKKERKAGKRLEIPPDLTQNSINDELLVPNLDPSSSIATATQQAQYQKITRRTRVVMPIKNIKLAKIGNKRWLIIDSDIDNVWQNIVDFWQNNGILLVEQDPVIGTMRTNWLENRASIDNGIISNTIRRVFDGIYSSSTRDQYRVRLEQVRDDGKVELFLTHFGMQEDVVQGMSGESQQPVWQATGADSELEAIMLRKIMVHLGLSDKKAQSTLAQKNKQSGEPLSSLITGKESALMINEDSGRAWRIVGIALDRVGFAVEDRKRNQGIYMVRYFDPTAEENKGFLSSIAFWRKDDKFDNKKLYQIILGSDGKGGVKTTVSNEQGERLNTETAKRILTLLQEQLK